MTKREQYIRVLLRAASGLVGAPAKGTPEEQVQRYEEVIRKRWNARTDDKGRSIKAAEGAHCDDMLAWLCVYDTMQSTVPKES